MTELFQRVQAAVGDVYHLESEMEGGGMSRLFLAMEASLNRRVVIKLLPPDHTSAVSAARFKQEIAVAASLQHPHILPVLGAGAEDGLLYYVMPYVAGESLRERLTRDGPLPVADAVRLLGEVAGALAFAHGKGVIHRDIKPENILLEGKHAVLADFGIARALMRAQTGERLTVSGTSVGTPGYMAPEQVAGDTVDERADLYSLAIVGYEMLSGAPPFSGSTAQAVLAAHLTTPPLPLHELRSEVPAAVSGVIARALSKSPEDRFGSAADFGEALRVGQSVAPEAPTKTGGRAHRRRRVALAVFSIVSFLVVCALAVHFSRTRAQGRALLEQLTPLVEQRDFDAVAESLQEAGVSLGARVLTPIRDRTAGFLSVTSTPRGSEVMLTRVSPVGSFGDRSAEPLGQTPVGWQPLVAGEYLLSVPIPGAEPFLRLAAVGLGDSTEVELILPTDEDVELGSLPVSAGPSPDGSVVEAFLIGRTEVTNADYVRFVDEGGYRDASLWPDQMRIGEQTLDRAAALERLVDRTGLPGPRNWSSGQPPPQKLNHPVNGVAWYEAMAYAAWAGAELPTVSEWYRAALADGAAPFPWGMDGGSVKDRANFGFAGTERVEAYPLGVSPFGVHDMAGNVREWVADEVPGSAWRMVVGGSWRDVSYMFERDHAEAFTPDTEGETIGFRLLKPIRNEP